jgi:hypothetical protein
MTLGSKWISAKKEYDAAVKAADKSRAALEKELKVLMDKADKERKKLKLKSKFSDYVADPVQIRVDGAQALIPLIVPVKKKKKEMEAIPRLKERKTFGAEPAFKDIDKVFAVGEKLIDAEIQDPSKWKAWHKLAISGLKKCAVAEKKFEAWMGRVHHEAEVTFDRDFKAIHRKMKDKGTPMMRKAGTYLQDS